MSIQSILHFDKEQLAKAIHDALANWDNPVCGENLLNQLLITHQAFSNKILLLRQAINDVLFKSIVQLRQLNENAANVLQSHYINDNTVRAIAKEMKVSEETVNRWQRDGYAQLAELIYAQELQACLDHVAWLEQRLEHPTYRLLFGVEAHVAQLSAQLNSREAPWVIALEGIGGIGKTTLADYLVRHSLAQARWHDVAWVTARQQSLALHGNIRPVNHPALSADELIDGVFTQLFSETHPPGGRNMLVGSGIPLREKRVLLHQRLKSAPHLIVIDNLETVHDVEHLLDTVCGLVNPSKFILTTRQSLLGETDVYHFRVPNLTQIDALSLVRHDARVSNVPLLTEASDAELAPIYDTVGGNPLAIRLVVGQTHVHPLERVLADLRAASTQYAENLYTYLYLQAWQRLDEISRRTLLMLPLVSTHGGDLDYLVSIGSPNGLSARNISDSLHTLVMLNLVDSVGELNQRRYTIHNLTRMFLMEQVLRWL